MIRSSRVPPASRQLFTVPCHLSTRLLFHLCASAFIGGFLLCSSASAAIRYTVSLAQPDQHLFRVTMVVPDVRDSLTVSLPAWNALYQIRDFSQRVLDVRAADDKGRALPVSKLDKQTWRVSSTGTVTLYYSIYWDEPGPFASQLNPTHAFLNLAMVLFYVPDRRSEDVSVLFLDYPSTWRIAVALKPATGAASVTSPFIAPSYDALVDAPVEIGPFEEFRLQGITPPVRVVIHGENYNRSQLEDSLRRIVIYQTGLMGGAPYDEFLFIYHYGPSSIVGGGGMEHAKSTAISASTLPGAINVGAHEFFHLWNVKRLRPAALEPVDYSREQYTHLLWFAEGVTSTYGSYTLVRTGLWTPRQFYDDLANEITTLESRPARAWQSVEQASLDAWLEKYPLYRRTDFSISYYNKGQLVGVLLDILLRDQTDNRASLDDVLRYLNDNFARRGLPYRDSDLLAASRAVFSRFAVRPPALLNSRPTASVVPTSRRFLSLASHPASVASPLGVSITEPSCRFLARNSGSVVDSCATRWNPEVQISFGEDGLRSPPSCISSDIDVAPWLSVTVDTISQPDRVTSPVEPPNTLDEFFARYVSGTEPLDYDFFLSKAGLALKSRPRKQPNSASPLLFYEIEELPNPTDRQRRIRDALLRGTTDPAR